jgi:hypothetical protein
MNLAFVLFFFGLLLVAGGLVLGLYGDSWLVTESDVAKEGRAARKRALGLAVGGGSASIVGVVCLLGALALFVRA